MSFASPFRASLLALLLASLAACNDSGSNDEPAASTEPINPQALQAAGMVTLGRGLPIAEDKIPASGEMVFRSAAEWQAVWAGNRAGSEAVAPMPDVDFGKYMVVGISGMAGGCDGLGIGKIEVSASALTVHHWFGGPPQKEPMACIASIFRASHYVLLPKSTLPVQFAGHKWEDVNPAWSSSLYTQAAPYENRMPQATSNGSPTCTQLIVPFAVRGSGAGLPQSLKVNAVAVWQDGVTRWLQPASAGETGITQGLISDSNWLQDGASSTAGIRSEPVLRGVARGCTSPQFKLDQPATVLLSVAAADGQAELVAQSTLTAAY